MINLVELNLNVVPGLKKSYGVTHCGFPRALKLMATDSHPILYFICHALSGLTIGEGRGKLPPIPPS
jgi:hypothetical protein